MTKRLLLLVCLAALALCAIPSPPVAHALDYDRADFSSQSQAQGYLLAGDPYRLDGDNGIACEDLPCPCPCSYGQPTPPLPSSQSAPAPVPAPVAPP